MSKQPLSDDIRQDIRDAFEFYDQGKKGYLSPKEYKYAFIALFGYKPSKYHKKILFEHVLKVQDTASNVFITKAQFMDEMCEKMARIPEYERLKEMFTTLDCHGKGFVTLQDLQQCTEHVATQQHKYGFESYKAPNDDQLLVMLQCADQSRSGKISLADLAYYLKP